MKDLTVLPNETSREQVPCIRLLLADGDDRARSLLAECARDVLPASTSLLEARDGTDALELAVQRRPQIALLDVNMPRLGGVEVALRLRALQPPMRLALQTADPGEHRERALARRLPLFDKFEIGRALSWLEVQAQACAGRPLSNATAREAGSCVFLLSLRNRVHTSAAAVPDVRGPGQLDPRPVAALPTRVERRPGTNVAGALGSVASTRDRLSWSR